MWGSAGDIAPHSMMFLVHLARVPPRQVQILVL